MCTLAACRAAAEGFVSRLRGATLLAAGSTVLAHSRVWPSPSSPPTLPPSTLRRIHQGSDIGAEAAAAEGRQSELTGFLGAMLAMETKGQQQLRLRAGNLLRGT